MNHARIQSTGDAPEVVTHQLPNFSDAPEVVHIQPHPVWPQQPYDPTKKDDYFASSKEVVEANTLPGISRSRRPRLIMILVALGVIIVIAVGTTVGVLTNKKQQQSPAPAPEASSTSVPTVTQSNNSSLAVTGFRLIGGGGFHYRLYHQAQSGTLAFIEYQSESGQWQGPFNISRTNAAPQTAMAASMVMTNNPPQWEYFWRDTNNNLRGQNWNQPVSQQVAGLEDSIDNYPVTTSSTSSVAAYWPYIATQDAVTTGSNSALRVTTYLGGGAPGAPPWVNSTTAAAAPQVAAASEGSAIAIVPLVAEYSRPWEAGLVYRTVDGLLAGVSLTWGVNATWEPWSIAGIPIPQASHIAAFAVASSSSSSSGNTNSANSVSTCILYQQSGGAIYYVTYSGGQWAQPATHAVFADASAGTDIACLTESLWTPYGSTVMTLSSQTDMSRCFFFVESGGIKEVLFDGSSWSEIGIVPI